MRRVTAPDGTEVEIPDVGEKAEHAQLLAICVAFGLDEAAQLLLRDPPPRPFIFDGCSGPVPQELPSGANVVLPCLLHDIEYYTGYSDGPGADEKRAGADYRLALNMLAQGALSHEVDMFLAGVRTAGGFWPDAKWGFGR